MKLSEAIRLGSMIRPQAFGYIFSNSGSCALGAVYEASGILAFDDDVTLLEETGQRLDQAFPLLKASVSCPVAMRCFRNGVGETIVHLNDWHRWTREQIADWVEQIEQQQDVKSVEGHEIEIEV
jgi:hypothetical protein